MATKTSKQDNGTASNKKYVVIRSGIRVSEREYDNVVDATEEVEHWQRILNQWPDGTKVTVEEYNDKKHRIY
jgi:hypothetical protein